MAGAVGFTDIDAFAALIPDGSSVALAHTLSGDYSAASMVATRALIRRGAKRLHLIGVPALSLQADLLIGAGCVAVVEAGSILLYEYGPAPRFIAAQKSGAIEVRDSTCPAIHAGLIAAEKGLPFLPVRGIVGSDLLRHHQARGDWKVIDNPFGTDDPIVLAGAIRPDVTLFHAPMADALGNVWIGARSELATMARSAGKTLVTYEKIYQGNLLEDAALALGTLPAIFVTAVSHQPEGAWPLGAGEFYAEDGAHLRDYARLAQTDDGFADYLARYVTKARQAA